MTQYEPTHFTVIDPRTFDGDPFTVAERACAQAEAVARVLRQCLEAAEIMARNAEMERNLQQDPDEPDAGGWDSSPLGRKFGGLQEDAETLEKGIGQAGRAASFNPKA